MNEKTIVIIRKWYGEYIAIFPYEIADSSPYFCMAYMTVGQHSACMPDGIVTDSKHTNNDESEELKDFISELKRIGYDLEIRKRLPSNSIDVRRKKLQEINRRK
jgi:hypothetical protein